MIVYLCKNLADGKSYIGQTSKTLKERKTHHFSEKNNNTYFHNSLKKI